MAYKRQIAYFDYMEYGEKKGNGGFCKWEQRNGIHKLEISLNAGKQSGAEKVKIFTRTGMKLQEVPLLNGCARIVFTKPDAEGNWDWEFSKIRIVLSENLEWLAEFPVEEKVRESVSLKKTEETVVALAKSNIVQESDSPKEKKAIELEPVKELEPIKEVIEEVHEIHEPDKKEEEEQEIQISLWEWLGQTHEKMRPFGTSEEYFRIVVEDIYRLQEEYHVLRNNQFLLHGYYNYKYLILGKKEMDSEEYWLGVPGIYHEREKMAARMYGFEKFEGAKRRYGVGDLGYYLITTK